MYYLNIHSMSQVQMEAPSDLLALRDLTHPPRVVAARRFFHYALALHRLQLNTADGAKNYRLHGVVN